MADKASKSRDNGMVSQNRYGISGYYLDSTWVINFLIWILPVWLTKLQKDMTQLVIKDQFVAI
jgi:hypothetical protein